MIAPKIFVGVLLSLWLPSPAIAGFLGPFLGLAKSGIEDRISKQCLSLVSGESEDLKEIMRAPCQSVAKPLAQCLIEETESSGRSLPVIKELLLSEFGEASELVMKRCIALTLNLPRTSFDKVQFKPIVETFRQTEK